MDNNDKASLAHLAHQLVSLGLVSRSFDLDLALSAPNHTSNASSDTPQDIIERQRQLQLHHKSRDQLVRCLWQMLSQRQDSNDRLEVVQASNKVATYELDRVKIQCDNERKARLNSDKDKQAAESRLKTTMTQLAQEQDRHRHARDELVKARSALQMVRTQALHDQKRREAEMSSTMARLQRMTSDATQSKFVVLNSQALIATSTSKASTLSGKASSSKAETALLQSALDECDKERRRCEQECSKLRALIGQVDEWAEGVFEIEAIARHEQVEKQRRDEQDESFHIPNPHLVLPVVELAGPLHRKLGQIKLGVASLADTTDALVEEARKELVEELERERSDRREIDQRRKDVEQELEQAREQLVASEQLVKDFTERQLAAAAVALPDDSDDDIAPVPVKQTTTVRPAAAEKKDRFETKRAKTVATFLEDLGIDTPAAPVAGKTLSSKMSAVTESKSRDWRVERKSEAETVRKRVVDKKNVPSVRVSPAPVSRSALSDILGMSNTPPAASLSRSTAGDNATERVSGAAAKIAAARERALAKSASRPRQRFGELN
ncbi:hypothetical protein ACM66B_003458 [Microbotryomycetes sp. NB124-2]